MYFTYNSGQLIIDASEAKNSHGNTHTLLKKTHDSSKSIGNLFIMHLIDTCGINLLYKTYNWPL